MTTVALGASRRGAHRDLAPRGPGARRPGNQLLQLGRVLRGREATRAADGRGRPARHVGAAGHRRHAADRARRRHDHRGVDALAGAAGEHRPPDRASAGGGRGPQPPADRTARARPSSPTSSTTAASAPSAERQRAAGRAHARGLRRRRRCSRATGRREPSNGRAFVAEPVRAGADAVPVLVLTERIDSAAVSRARGFFLIGAVLALRRRRHRLLLPRPTPDPTARGDGHHGRRDRGR